MVHAKRQPSSCAISTASDKRDFSAGLHIARIHTAELHSKYEKQS